MAIDRDKIDSLLGSVGASARARLTTLYNATVTTLKAYNENSTASRLKDWQAAEKALEEAVAAIEGTSEASRRDGDEVLGSMADVIRWLQTERYCAPGRDDPVKPAKVYKDGKKGLLSFANKNGITLTEVMAYVARAQLMKASVNRADEAEDLNIQKLRHETRKAKEDADRKEFDNARDRGLYLKKEDVELQTALKIGMFEAELKNWVRTSVIDWINQIEKSSNKPQALCDLVFEGIDDLLNRLARMEEINVIITRRN